MHAEDKLDTGVGCPSAFPSKTAFNFHNRIDATPAVTLLPMPQVSTCMQPIVGN